MLSGLYEDGIDRNFHILTHQLLHCQKLAQQFCFQDRTGMVVLHWCRTLCFTDRLVHGGAAYSKSFKGESIGVFAK
jgi:hypothetical protein